MWLVLGILALAVGALTLHLIVKIERQPDFYDQERDQGDWREDAPGWVR